MCSAIAGLSLANTEAGPGLAALRNLLVGIPGIGLELGLGDWVTEGLLAVFFFIVAAELRAEFTVGTLNHPKKAALPVVAALGGVATPAVLYLAFTHGTPLAEGWPVPTATDIAFAVGVLAIFGRALPPAVRVFLLTLAVLDDLIGIIFIAVLFTHTIDPVSLVLAVAVVVAFACVTRLGLPRPVALSCALVLSMAAWYFTHDSGIHATISAVALGLCCPAKSGDAAARLLQPISNGAVLPLFAFVAAGITLPDVSLAGLSPAFWGILVGLPVGKLVGITAAGYLGSVVAKRHGLPVLRFGDLLVVGFLGGIGFTVSLLMNSLAFAPGSTIGDEGTLAVLLASAVAVVASAVVVSARSRHYDRADALGVPPLSGPAPARGRDIGRQSPPPTTVPAGPSGSSG